MADILQEFLSLGLLDIGDDDSRLEKLRSASKDLCGVLQQNQRHSIYHGIVVFTPETTVTDASYNEAEAALQQHWNTFRNRFNDSPTQLFRTISLQALSDLVSKDADTRAA